jgi:hypothetical protein
MRHRLLSAAAGVRFQARPYQLCVEPLGPVSLSTCSFPCQSHSINAPYSSSPTRFPYQKDKRAKPGHLPISKALSDIGGQ